MKIKVDKTLAASVALHVLVLGYGLVSFSTKAYEMTPEDSVPVDVVSPDQLHETSVPRFTPTPGYLQSHYEPRTMRGVMKISNSSCCVLIEFDRKSAPSIGIW